MTSRDPSEKKWYRVFLRVIESVIWGRSQ